MGRLLVLNVVLVLLAVYASARYTLKSADDTQIDEEIDAIARALDGENDDDDDSVDCMEFCDEDCNCDIEECQEVCDTLGGIRTMQTRGSNVVDKKLWGIRIRLPRIPPIRRWKSGK